jgi:polysaccharide biosynthesis/export protein VpsN
MSMKSVGTELQRWAVVCGLVWGGLYLDGCRTRPPAEQQFAELPPGVIHTSTVSPIPVAATPAQVLAPATAPVAVSATSPATVPAAISGAGPEPEVFRVGDSLTVTFTDTPTLIPLFEEKIKEDGTITLTLNQVFKADGKTRGSLAKEIRDRYVPDYFKEMTVTVKQEASTRWYYVDGEVKAPNRQIYNSRITVLKAIASAGGFTDFANKKKVKLTRMDGRTQIVNCPKALDNPALDPELYPGDKIHVPRRLW